MCIFVGVQWKPDCHPHIEDYYGFKVNRAHVQDLECLIVQLQTDGKHIEVYQEKFPAIIKLPNMKITGYKIEQFPINLSLAITGHKLQGMTLDMLILCETNMTPNWLYVLLSQVTSLKGFFSRNH
jgi:hypothetical protein